MTENKCSDQMKADRAYIKIRRRKTLFLELVDSQVVLSCKHPSHCRTNITKGEIVITQTLNFVALFNVTCVFTFHNCLWDKFMHCLTKSRNTNFVNACSVHYSSCTFYLDCDTLILHLLLWNIWMFSSLFQLQKSRL